MSAPVDVLEVLAENIRRAEEAGNVERSDRLQAAHAAIAELIEADRELDAARTLLEDLNRRIAESGWIDIEFDALRKAGSRFAGARIRRAAALDRVGGVA